MFKMYDKKLVKKVVGKTICWIMVGASCAALVYGSYKLVCAQIGSKEVVEEKVDETAEVEFVGPTTPEATEEPKKVEEKVEVENKVKTETKVESVVVETPKPVSTPAPTPVVEAVETVDIPETSDTNTYYDIPLRRELQDHIFKECGKYGIDPTIVLGMIKRESNYKANAVNSDGTTYGLMQVNPKWHSGRMAVLECSDLLDPYQNITVGVNYLGELFANGKSTEWTLMAYNGGVSYANRKVSRGEISSYARGVLSNAKNLKIVEG